MMKTMFKICLKKRHFDQYFNHSILIHKLGYLSNKSKKRLCNKSSHFSMVNNFYFKQSEITALTNQF